MKKIAECAACAIPFHTDYGRRMHAVRVHGTSIKTLKRKRKAR
jgi:hypothetical protein